jgi:hypothetical protein
MGHVLGGHVTVTDDECRLYIFILQLGTRDYTTVCISYRKSDLCVAYFHELMSCLCTHNEAAVL